MRRYDQILGFDGLSAFVRNIPRQKVDYARMALLRHREDELGPGGDEDIVRQFGLDGMHEFWEIELSEPMTCKAFGHALAVHLAAPREPTQAFEAHIRQALRAARSYDQPWFMAIPEPLPSNKLDHRKALGFLPSDVVFVPLDPPADGIDLDKLRVQPRAAVEWMLSTAQRRHLVPPSLAEALGHTPEYQARPLSQNLSAERGRMDPTSASVAPIVLSTPVPQGPPAEELPRPEQMPEQATPYRTGMPGRPTSKDLVAAEWKARVERGEALLKKSEEAKVLFSWLIHKHPNAARPKKKTLQNQLSRRFT